jgi:hypothetical protein
MRAHRESLHRRGLRSIQIWVPHVRSAAFKAEAHRQSLAVASSAHAAEDQDLIDTVSDRGAAWDAARAGPLPAAGTTRQAPPGGDPAGRSL